MHLQVRDASKAYAGLPALENAALDLRGGEVLGLVGENGAGKSTLIKLLAGLERPDSLRLHLNGAPVTIPDSAAARRLGMRFIHQELNIVPALSVAENLYLNNPLPRFAGIFAHRAAMMRGARRALQELGIAHIDLRQRASRLSPGDAMLVKIASAFIGAESSDKPLIYIMDEPTAALNQAEVELLFGVIQRLRDRGCALLVVTHRLQELFRIAQRVTVMRDGRVVATHDIRATSADALIREMTGDSANPPAPKPPTPNPSPTRGDAKPPTPNPSPTRGDAKPPTPNPSPTRGDAKPPTPNPSPTRGEGLRNARNSLESDSPSPLWGARRHCATARGWGMGGQESPLLRVDNLQSDHLSHASFTLHAGEIVGVAGLAGSGRSQLLQALMGIDQAHSGSIELAGEALRHHAPAQRWARGMAYLPEERRSQGLAAGRARQPQHEPAASGALPPLAGFHRPPRRRPAQP